MKTEDSKIRIAFIKVPVVLSCKDSEVESKISKHFFKGAYAGHEYGEVEHYQVIGALSSQSYILKKLKEEIL